LLISTATGGANAVGTPLHPDTSNTLRTQKLTAINRTATPKIAVR